MAEEGEGGGSGSVGVVAILVDFCARHTRGCIHV